MLFLFIYKKILLYIIIYLIIGGTWCITSPMWFMIDMSIGTIMQRTCQIKILKYII